MEGVRLVLREMPVRFIVTPGQTNDITRAHALIAGLPASNVLADKAYDADHFRQAIDNAGAAAVIQPAGREPASPIMIRTSTRNAT